MNNGYGSNILPADGDAYIGMDPYHGYEKSCGQNLRKPLKAGVTYTFLVDVAYGIDYLKPVPGSVVTPQVPIYLEIRGVCFYYSSSTPPPPLWRKLIPMARTSWQTDTVTITPTTDITRLVFVATGTTGVGFGGVDNQGALLLDNLRTLTGPVLQKADGTAQASGKAFRLLWQPVLTVGGLDSLARPQLKGTVRTFRGGRVLLPPVLQVKDSKGFYFFQEATPAAGQDTLYYGLYVRNMPLANGTKDDTLRHLYHCRRSFGSQAGLLSGSLQPLALGSPSTAPRVAPTEGADPVLVRHPTPVPRSAAPRRRADSHVRPRPVPSVRPQRAH